MKKNLFIVCLLFIFEFCIYNSVVQAATIAKDADYNFYTEENFHFSELSRLLLFIRKEIGFCIIVNLNAGEQFGYIKPAIRVMLGIRQ